jgi:hypothetical protein
MYKFISTLLRYVFFLSALMIFPSRLSAQYDDLRYPQAKEEIKQFRQMKIKIERKFLIEGKKKILDTEREFDSLGRLIRKITPQNRQYITYDNNGRISLLLDSARGGNEYFRADNEFEYDKYGMISFSRIPPHSLSFSYDPSKKILSEITLLDYEQYRKRYFYYDATGRLKQEDWYYPNGKKEKNRRIVYNKAGKEISEVILKYFENGILDSEAVEYKYDSKNKLLEQKTISTTFQAPTDSIILKPDSDTTVYAYKHDALGNCISEFFHYSTSGYDHRYEWKYNLQGLKSEERYYDFKGKLLKKYIFIYTFQL